MEQNNIEVASLRKEDIERKNTSDDVGGSTVF